MRQHAASAMTAMRTGCHPASRVRCAGLRPPLTPAVSQTTLNLSTLNSGEAHRKTRYRGLEKNTKQLYTLFGLANLVLARRWLLAPQGPSAS
jgi:IS5 family transposase